ncbi:DUF3883 domain-containing protein [Enterococcus sp. 669A]|uniref:DUF3883 domain-containing protein n=1 Tax=Candidatus Enterococcus moelleringii TaxID=2815325 RepID=A0ABS3LDV3_9ENTE|nr:DUF3883 domain-containing protein [Enterococcus sp. 669A]MBO1307811.1 DUF3883 domain-containing protein [Enterococcus sp. 669A]
MKKEKIEEIVDWAELERIFEVCNSTDTEIQHAKNYFLEISSTKFVQTVHLIHELGLEKPYTKDAFVKCLLSYIFENFPDFFVFSVHKTTKKLLFSIPIRYYVLRNLLLQMRVIEKKDLNTFIFSASKYQNMAAEKKSLIKKKKTLAELVKDLENKAQLGEQAEHFVLEYERNKYPKKEILYVSPFDVSAGYDILSFFSDNDFVPNKMIEVKCVGDDYSFYISKNELSVAEKNKDKYFLCLVHYSLAKEPVFIENVCKNISLYSRVVGENFKVTFKNHFIGERKQKK